MEKDSSAKGREAGRLQPGQSLAHYRVTAAIGAGGMGEVYRATDTRLGRDVALKVLPDEASSPERIERFRREARAAAALNHPGIVTLYSVEEADGIHFLTMELVEGEGLEHLVPKGGLPVERLLALGASLAEALAAAHEKGIVHRDLKPSNVIVAKDGRVKVLDFGLAKLLAPEPEPIDSVIETQMKTKEGIVLGTLPYMSPEQLEGGDVDARSDLFSLGVMLHQMATGARPFRGTTDAALLAAILRETPPPVTEARPDLPRELGRLISRCLEKSRDRRIQTARELHGELTALQRKLASGESARGSAESIGDFGGRPALAVLPFENLTRDPEQEFFADGLAEDLITRLSLWRSFPVIARNSSFAFKGKSGDLKLVAAELGVRYVVLGSVRKSGSRVRIAAQLVDATTGQHIWSSTYDRELTDVFAVQDEISEAIASPLVSDLQRAEHERAQRRAPESLEAWGLYQRALPLIHRFTPEDSARAREYLERAVALDPQFATALARLAEARLWDVLNLWTETPDETLAQALAESRRAAALDPRDAEAQAILALVLLTTGDSAGSREASRRALDLNPSLPMALTFYAYFLHMTGGSPVESVALIHRAMKLSPRDPIEWVFYDVLGCAYWNGGRFDEGLAASERLLALLPSYYFGYVWAAINQVGLGHTAEAREVVRKGRLVQPSLSIELVRKSLGALAPDVDRRLADALRAAGLPETAAPGA